MKSKTIILIIFLITNVFAQSELYKLRLANNKRNPINKLSLNYSYSNKNEEIQNHRYSFINLSGQAIVGSALAVGFTIIPLGALAANIFSRNSSDESQSVLVLVTISSYLLGAATGVHWIAKSENSELS